MTQPDSQSSQTSTATSADVAIETPSVTRTISNVVEEVGALRSQASVLVDEATDLRDSVGQVQVDAFAAQTEKLAASLSRQSVESLLNEVAALGFSWRHVAQLVSVSIPAIQKWRRGGGATPAHRHHLARVLAVCNLLEAHPFSIQDVPSWLEIPLVADAPVAPIDLLGQGRIDLLLRWAGHTDARPEEILDEIDPGWRDRRESPFEVFTAPDGQPGIRFRRE